jgi:hypothetical protein
MLAWPVYGRWQADSLLTRAGALDPDDPEPFYYLGLTGLALRGDDGEWVARRGLTRLLALEPEYRDTWTLWSGLYRGDEERRAGIAALERHAGGRSPDLWRSQLLIEQGAYDAARPLLDSLVERWPEDPAPRALFAQLLYEMGLDAAAEPVYRAALDRATADTGDVVWRQVRSIASPAEREAYRLAPPATRPAFFRRFWAFRRPDLDAPLNARIGEHFRRLREARLGYALLHPNSRFFHSPARRSAPLFAADVAGCLREVAPVPPAVLPGGAGPTEGPSDTSVNLEDGIDDRGRIFVRHGAPDQRFACANGSETWRYHLPQGVLQVTFARHTGGDSAGDVLVTPIAAGEADAARWLLETDRPDGPATLDLAFWTAAFRGATRWQTKLVVRPDSVVATAVLLDATGDEIARDSTRGDALRLAAATGRYLLALDARRGDRVGRVRNGVTLPSFSGDSLGVSDLLVTDRDVPPEREAMIGASPPRLRLARERPLRVYAEVYGLAGLDGRSRYEAEYRFESVGPRRGGRRTTVRFHREQPAQGVTIESLVVDPGRLPPGRYRLWLEVRDGTLVRRAASSRLEFELR